MSPLTCWFPFLLKSHLTSLWLWPLLITFPPWSFRTQPFRVSFYLAGRWSFSLFLSSLLTSRIWLQHSMIGYFIYLGLNPSPCVDSSKSRIKSQTLILRPGTPDKPSPLEQIIQTKVQQTLTWAKCLCCPYRSQKMSSSCELDTTSPCITLWGARLLFRSPTTRSSSFVDSTFCPLIMPTSIALTQDLMTTPSTASLLSLLISPASFQTMPIFPTHFSQNDLCQRQIWASKMAFHVPKLLKLLCFVHKAHHGLTSCSLQTLIFDHILPFVN